MDTTFSWAGDLDVAVARVYALAFTPDGRMLLVGGAPGDPCRWLPGGGVEPGEAPEAALARELREEAAATIHALERLGVQRVEGPGGASRYQALYCCRVTLADEFVALDVTERRVVAPEDFLDTLFWGHADPTAALLLERALRWQRSHPLADGG